MASYVDNGNKLDWALPFQRTGNFPIDRSSMFSSYADAVKYAAGNASNPDSRGLQGSSYVGQIITVYENDTVNVYKINADRTLSTIGEGSGGIDVYETICTEDAQNNKIYFTDEAYNYIKTNKPLIIKMKSNADSNSGVYLQLFGITTIINENNNEILHYQANNGITIGAVDIRYNDTSSTGSNTEKTTIGHLSSLTTTNKSSIVNAINEVNAKPSSGSNYDVTITSMTVTDQVTTAYFATESIAILQNKPGYICVYFPNESQESFIPSFPLLFYKEEFDFTEEQNTPVLNKLVYKSMPIAFSGEDEEDRRIVTLTFDLSNQNPYSSAILDRIEVSDSDVYETNITTSNKKIMLTDEAYTYIKTNKPTIIKANEGSTSLYFQLSMIGRSSQSSSINTLLYFMGGDGGFAWLVIRSNDTASTGSDFITTSFVGTLTIDYSSSDAQIINQLNSIFSSNNNVLMYMPVLKHNNDYLPFLGVTYTGDNNNIARFDFGYTAYGTFYHARLTLTENDGLYELTKSYETSGGGGGTGNYPDLTNLPSINNVTLVGDKTSADLGLASQASVTDINSKIPSTASSSNKLLTLDTLPIYNGGVQ